MLNAPPGPFQGSLGIGGPIDETPSEFAWTPLVTSISLQIDDEFDIALGAPTGGTLPYEYRLTGLPAWMTHETTTNRLNGTAPSSAETGTFTIAVDDANEDTISQTFNYQVGTAPVTPVLEWLTSNPGINGTVNVDIGTHVRSAQFTTGVGSINYTASGLPAGLTYGPNGIISGTPTAAGVSNVTIRASATGAVTISDSLTITVASAAEPGEGTLRYNVHEDLLGDVPGQNHRLVRDTAGGLHWQGIEKYYGANTVNIELFEEGDTSRDHRSTTWRTMTAVVTFYSPGSWVNSSLKRRAVQVDLRLDGWHEISEAQRQKFLQTYAAPGGQASTLVLSPSANWKALSWNLNADTTLTDQERIERVADDTVHTAQATIITNPIDANIDWLPDAGNLQCWFDYGHLQHPTMTLLFPVGMSNSGFRTLVSHMRNNETWPATLPISRIQFPYSGIDLSGLS